MNIFPYILSSLHQLPQTTLVGEVEISAPNKHFKRIPNDWIMYLISDGTMKIKVENREYHPQRIQKIPVIFHKFFEFFSHIFIANDHEIY